MKADWPALTEEINEYGCALTPRILTSAQCRKVAGLYDDAGLFRSTIDMARYRFGSGQHRYFDRPLPDLVERLDMYHAAGQSKSTPILLRYQKNDWNALHRDLYGGLVFLCSAVPAPFRPACGRATG